MGRGNVRLNAKHVRRDCEAPGSTAAGISPGG